MSTASRLIGIAIAVLLATAATAHAGPLPLDPNGMGGAFQGAKIFQNKGGLTTSTTNLEFSVYAPGQFNKSFPGLDPSTGSQYVYAYEAFNLSVAPLPRSFVIFTVGLNPGAQAQNIGYLPVGGLAPVTSAFGGTPASSARWDYTGASVPVGQNTRILLFTSPLSPTLITSSVTGGGLGSSNTLPTPVPEPASLALIGVGSAMLLYRRLKARNRVA